jgi:Pyridine nucleotide-disulphide oxidoreductase/BFD-like [2Fe-2S] binding domain
VTTSTVQVAVVGGGPAGLAAAGESHAAGARTLLIEERSVLGGRAMIVPGARGLAEGLIRDLGPTDVWRNSPVWGLSDRVLTVLRSGRVHTVSPDVVILATGAREWMIPFPGWTLPGVFTVEAAWEIVRAGKVGPDTGPLTVAGGPEAVGLANRCAERGAAVTFVGTERPKALSDAVTYLPGTMAGATGTDALAGVALADGSIHVCHMLCVESPRAPVLDLVHLARCPCVYQSLLGGFIPRHDPTMAAHGPTEGLYVAGDVAGVDTPRAAAESGRLSARHALAALGVLADAQEKIDDARRRFLAASIPLHARAREALLAGASPDEVIERWDGPPETVLCPCEGVMVASLQAAVDDGAQTPDDLKRWTRCGMGECQWRRCGPPVMRWLSGVREVPIGRLPLPRIRPPVRPMPVSALAAVDGHA